jgi:regulator of nonsense transcripts 1
VNKLPDDWTEYPDWLKDLFVPKQSADLMQTKIADRSPAHLDAIMDFALEHHAEDELFWTYNVIVHRIPPHRASIVKWMDRFPPLAFVVLKAYPPNDSLSLPPEIGPVDRDIIRNIIRSSNSLGIATLSALERIVANIARLSLEVYFDLMTLASLCVRSQELVQEVLLVLNECRASVIAESAALRYAHQHALAIAFDRAGEAADECPCGQDGNPTKQKTAPTIVQLVPVPDQPAQVIAHVRIDARTSVRLHSHVRLQTASRPDNQHVGAYVLDGLVMQATKGEMKIELLYPPPPEMSMVNWKMYNAGSVVCLRICFHQLGLSVS